MTAASAAEPDAAADRAGISRLRGCSLLSRPSGRASRPAAGGSMRPWVPDDWKPRLRAYLRERCGEDRDRLSASDFPAGQSVVIRFPDGSHVLFRYAFAVPDEAGRE